MALLRYTLLRLLILVVVGALVWLIWPGLPVLAVLLVAVFVSGLISIFVLNRSRDEVSARLDRRVSTIKARLNERTAAEDAWDEVQRESASEDPEPVDHRTDERDGPAGTGQVSSA